MKKFRESSSMDRRHGSGQPRTVSTEKDKDLIEELVCSKEEPPHTHLAPRKIAEQTGINLSSIRRMVKKRNLKQFKTWKHHKRVKGLETEGKPALAFLEKDLKVTSVWSKKTFWQDEKDFTLEVPVNLQNDQACGKGKKSDISDENVLSSTNKMSKKVMVSAAISWYGVTKPFFVNSNSIKVKENFCQHLRKGFLH